MHRILIVDDDQAALESLSEVMEVEGYGVERASNGMEALQILNDASPPCLVILDLLMPSMNGWRFLEEVKNDPKLASIPVVVATALIPVGKIDAAAVIHKPIAVPHLLSIAARLC